MLAPIATLTLASPAIANAIAPTVYFWPGVLPLNFGLAIPASVLAAVLERPFVSASGVRASPLKHSLRANAISLLVGYLTLPFAVPALYQFGPVWSLCAVTLSILWESLYLRSRATEPFRLRPLIWGNLFSSVVLLLIPVAAIAFKNARPDLVWRLMPIYEWLWWGTVLGGVVIFVMSFALLSASPGTHEILSTDAAAQAPFDLALQNNEHRREP